MLALFLGILKVILYIILFIIVFILLLLMIILLVPIRYQVEGEKYDTIKLDVCVSWLLHLVSFKYHMEEEPIMSLKIFGKTIMGEKKEKKSKSKNKNKIKEDKKKKTDKKRQIEENKDDNTDEHIRTEVKKTTISDDSTLKPGKEEIEETKKTIRVEKEEIKETNKTIKVEKKEIEETKKTINKEEIEKKHAKKKRKKIKKSKTKKLKKDKSNENNSKWKQIFNNIKDFLKNEENRAVIKMIKDKVLKMLKHILPNKFHSKIIIGTGDPASTGYVVGVVSILYTVTGNKLNVIPNFEEQIFQGCFYGKGRIYLIVLLKNTLRIILDKRVRKLYKTYKA